MACDVMVLYAIDHGIDKPSYLLGERAQPESFLPLKVHLLYHEARTLTYTLCPSPRRSGVEHCDHRGTTELNNPITSW